MGIYGRRRGFLEVLLPAKKADSRDRGIEMREAAQVPSSQMLPHCLGAS